MANKAKFTPGPWRWASHYADNGGKVHSLESEEKTVIDGEFGVSCSNEDARLIAACPTMYDYISGMARSGDIEAVAILEAIHASR